MADFFPARMACKTAEVLIQEHMLMPYRRTWKLITTLTPERVYVFQIMPYTARGQFTTLVYFGKVVPKELHVLILCVTLGGSFTPCAQ